MRVNGRVRGLIGTEVTVPDEFFFKDTDRVDGCAQDNLFVGESGGQKICMYEMFLFAIYFAWEIVSSWC